MERTLTLISHHLCPYVQRAAIALAEKGVPFERRDVDLADKPINDACGVQRLPNGNTVVTSHHAQRNEVKLTEVTPAKKVVWIHRDPQTPGIHHFQILDTNGQPLVGVPAEPGRGDLEAFRSAVGP